MSKRVYLIVDDEAGIRTYLRAILESREIDSLEAGTAAQALQTLRKFSDRIELVITDINMPGDMNGVDLAYAVRQTHPSIPVLLISGGPGDKVPVSFPYVSKPFRPATILDAADALTSSRTGAGGPHRIATAPREHW